MEAIDTLIELAKALELLKIEDNPDLAAGYLNWALGAGLESAKTGLVQFLTPRAVGATIPQVNYAYEIPFLLTGTTTPVALKIVVGEQIAQVRARVAKAFGVVNPHFSIGGQDLKENVDLVTQYLANRTSPNDYIQVSAPQLVELPLIPSIPTALSSITLPSEEVLPPEPPSLLTPPSKAPLPLPKRVSSVTLKEELPLPKQASPKRGSPKQIISEEPLPLPPLATSRKVVSKEPIVVAPSEIPSAIPFQDRVQNVIVTINVTSATTLGDLKTLLEGSLGFMTGTVRFDSNGQVIPDTANVLQVYINNNRLPIGLSYQPSRNPATIKITQYINHLPSVVVQELLGPYPVSQLKADYAKASQLRASDLKNVKVLVNGRPGQDDIDLFMLAKDSSSPPAVTVGLKNDI